ncbi:MAG: deoxynucleoside kinase [candidate division NC10 bacterium]|nr:deoxynucleoside kinase [candidate division NC10 bacterium]MBI2163276.1 deoxynucleoside kinase [candidate division NC10 bacterium]MBI2563648.1 deoxynucleoside kinase [candidate division NC10 bacterium]MBI3085122.1 deoxynucleoside kinase [candidate division NC10 bacterium]
MKETPAPPRYIVVEGPIGVGKTSLVDLLSERLGARKLLEVAEDNPILPNFYKDSRRYAFQTQLWFLLNRFRQQQELGQFDLFRQILVADYLFAKDKIFAYLTLEDHELALYERVHALLQVRVPTPDLVIFLQATTDALLQRIAIRGKGYEREIGRKYLDDLNAAYTHFFFHYTASPLLVVNTSDIDFVNRREDFEDLIEKIGQTRAGMHYYVPLGSRK